MACDGTRFGSKMGQKEPNNLIPSLRKEARENTPTWEYWSKVILITIITNKNIKFSHPSISQTKDESSNSK